MFHAAHVVALVVFGRVDVAVDRQDAAGTPINSRVADVRTAHEVALDIPETAQLNPHAPLHAEHAVVRYESFRGSHVRTVGRTRNAGGEFVAGGDEGLRRERLLAPVGVGIDEEALAGFGVFEACPEEIVLVGGQDIAFRYGHVDPERVLISPSGCPFVVALRRIRWPGRSRLFEHLHQTFAVVRDVVGEVAVVGTLECQDNLRSDVTSYWTATVGRGEQRSSTILRMLRWSATIPENPRSVTRARRSAVRSG